MMSGRAIRVGHFYQIRHERKVILVAVRKVHATYVFGGNGQPKNVNADVVTPDGTAIDGVPAKKFISAAEPWELPR